jgi:hypothetical protein
MDPPTGPIDELYFHLPKIVLAELSSQSFETNQRLGRLRTKRGCQRVQRCLASPISRLPHSPQNLKRRKIRRLAENLHDRFPETRHHAGPANLSLRPFPGVIDVQYRTLLRYPLHRTQRSTAHPCHFRLAMTSLQQDLNLVSLQHPQHPPPSAPGHTGA